MFSKAWKTLNSRAASLTVLTHVWLLLFMYTYPRALKAATFADDMRNFDYESMLWAIATGLLGGFARTLVSLASDKMIVNSVWKEAAKDAVVSIIAGGAALVVIEVLRATYWSDLPSAVRFAVILFAGASRTAFFGRINDFITNILDAWTKRLAGKFTADKLVTDFEAKEVGQAQAVIDSIVQTAGRVTPNLTPVDDTVRKRMKDRVSDPLTQVTETAGQNAEQSPTEPVAGTTASDSPSVP